ncbi:EamA family transporter [Bacillus gaemokensis]|uniref:EamA family transporter n=1 Tax=Bacillus gaemokensis TaxID=574375 RepID=UPI001373302E
MLKLTTVTNVILAYYTAPAFMVILGFFFLKEGLNLRTIHFIVLVFLGLYLLFSSDSA